MEDASSAAPLLTQPERLERRLKEIPAEPGCYLMRDGEDRILYVGKSKSLRSRVRSYFRSRHDLSPRIRLMTRQVCEIEFIVTDSEAEALALESNLIVIVMQYIQQCLKSVLRKWQRSSLNIILMLAN